MGIYIGYTLCAEGTDEDIRTRLENVRQQCLDLPITSVSPVHHIDPIYNPLNVSLLLKEGFALPPSVARRVTAAEADGNDLLRSVLFELIPGYGLPTDLQRRYIAPALDFVAAADLWNKADLPDQLAMTNPWGQTSYTINRAVIEVEFVNVLIRYGYVLRLDPGEGSEPVTFALTTYRPAKPDAVSLWTGHNVTKTQYAKNFILAHESVCRALDILQSHNLLYSADDNSGYYAARSWEKAGKRVNAELDFARTMSAAVDVAIGDLREEGATIKVVNNAADTPPIDFSPRLKPDDQ